MKFNDIPYKRPDFESFEGRYNTLIETFKNASSFEQQDSAMIDVYKLREEYETMYELSYIKYTTDTADKGLEKEVNFFDEVQPRMTNLANKLYLAINASKFKREIAEKWGERIVNIADYEVKGFDPILIEDQKADNKLRTEYVKLKGTAEIELKGEKLNLAGIGKYLVDEDRETRKEANVARWKFFASKQEELDTIFDKMVKLRHRMALKMGHKNFVQLGYQWMKRMDYDQDMVANFRKQIVEEVVPLVQRLREQQRKRLGYERIEDHDMYFHFLSGNPKPVGTPDEIIAKAKTMYNELSPETDAFFKHMLDYDLMDLKNRPGKADAGYCWCLTEYKHPFIFANFNGTAGDIDVLTHEAGHAFQYWQSRNFELMEYRDPSSESAEIHSMSMEFLTYPWMEGFFEEDAEKYFFSHLNGSLLFLPYGTAVDHFQHVIYENPDYTPDQRAKAWLDICAIYLPDYKMDAIPYLESGRYWQKQSHIYESPFYYIDYVLAQICAFQFWQKAKNNREEAWKDYLRLCSAGGSMPFLELVKLANLRSPFEDGTVKSITDDIVKHLDTFDDSKF